MLDLPKPMHTTPLALNMLAQPTQRREIRSTRRLRAYIQLILMSRARQVLVQRRKTLIRAMTEVAFVRITIPCGTGGVVICARVRGGGSEETRRVGDDIVAIELADLGVDDAPRETRDASTRFEV